MRDIDYKTLFIGSEKIMKVYGGISSGERGGSSRGYF